jgi:hypothetical protein
MVRSNKDLVGVSRPQKIVEEFLLLQGFKRKGSKEEPVFRMNIQDASTHQLYLLDIPFREEQVESEKRIRFGAPCVLQGGIGNRLSDPEVPLPIAWAAESKLAEVADYLASLEQVYTSY